MPDLVPIRRALVSVSDKADLVAFARQLVTFGVEIVSTGGTARALAESGVAVTPIDVVTGFPEILDGRVKTLHPLLHGGILARRDLDAHRAAMDEHGIRPIDLVCVNLYPFERKVRQPGITEGEAIEEIDVGGPALVRSAAKNHAFVTVATSSAQFGRIIQEMREHGGATTLALRRDLAAAAFTRTAEYDTNISAWMRAGPDAGFPATLHLSYAHRADLRYGENPHQRAALYADPTASGPSVVTAEHLHGSLLSYNNLGDAAAALAVVEDLAAVLPGRACAAVVKHTNPCGAAARDGPAGAFEAAHEGDPLAAYGGILAISRPVDEGVADVIARGGRFLEVIVAPSFAPGAAALLGERWTNVRLLAVGPLGREGAGRYAYRSIPGGLLAQERDTRLADVRQWKHAAGPTPPAAVLDTAALAWTSAKHLASNAIAIASDLALIGVGAGQVDRVTACRIAAVKAGARLRGGAQAVAASDAFFPFPDGPEVLIDAGVSCIVHPGGSKRDQETLDLCEERGVTCLLTAVRHFRH